MLPRRRAASTPRDAIIDLRNRFAAGANFPSERERSCFSARRDRADRVRSIATLRKKQICDSVLLYQKRKIRRKRGREREDGKCTFGGPRSVSLVFLLFLLFKTSRKSALNAIVTSVRSRAFSSAVALIYVRASIWRTAFIAIAVARFRLLIVQCGEGCVQFSPTLARGADYKTRH